MRRRLLWLSKLNFIQSSGHALAKWRLGAGKGQAESNIGETRQRRVMVDGLRLIHRNSGADNAEPPMTLNQSMWASTNSCAIGADDTLGHTSAFGARR